VILLQGLNLELELLELLFSGDVSNVTPLLHRLDDLFLLLDHSPEELLPEVIFILLVNIGALRKHLVLSPTHDCVLEQQSLSLVIQELLRVVQLLDVVDVFICVLR